MANQTEGNEGNGALGNEEKKMPGLPSFALLPTVRPSHSAGQSELPTNLLGGLKPWRKLLAPTCLAGRLVTPKLDEGGLVSSQFDEGGCSTKAEAMRKRKLMEVDQLSTGATRFADCLGTKKKLACGLKTSQMLCESEFNPPHLGYWRFDPAKAVKA